MPLSPLVIHIVPLQITLDGTTATISCNDPRVTFAGDVLVFTFNDLHENDPVAQQRVCFVVEDLPDTNGYDNYFNMASAPPLERLEGWKRNGTVSRSPEMRPGCEYEVVCVAYGVPRASNQTSAPVKLGHGRRRFEIEGTGAPASDIY